MAGDRPARWEFGGGQPLPSGGYAASGGAYRQVAASPGTLVFEQGENGAGGSGCAASCYCSRPSPMKIVWAPNDAGTISGAAGAAVDLRAHPSRPLSAGERVRAPSALNGEAEAKRPPPADP